MTIIHIKNADKVKRRIEEMRLEIFQKYGVPYERLFPGVEIIDAVATDVLLELPAEIEIPAERLAILDE